MHFSETKGSWNAPRLVSSRLVSSKDLSSRRIYLTLPFRAGIVDPLDGWKNGCAVHYGARVLSLKKKKKEERKEKKKKKETTWPFPEAIARCKDEIGPTFREVLFFSKGDRRR